jgi:hypothetical protein
MLCFFFREVLGCVDLDSDVVSISNDSGGDVEAIDFA